MIRLPIAHIGISHLERPENSTCQLVTSSILTTNLLHEVVWFQACVLQQKRFIGRELHADFCGYITDNLRCAVLTSMNMLCVANGWVTFHQTGSITNQGWLVGGIRILEYSPSFINSAHTSNHNCWSFSSKAIINRPRLDP